MELLDKAGIEIPFPQRDLRLRAVDADRRSDLALAERIGESQVGESGVERA